MIERTRVSLVSAPPGEAVTTVIGPTPVDAPYLASELLAQLLGALPAAVRAPRLRVTMTLETLMTFSFELHAPVMAELAARGAALEVCVNIDEPDFELFEPYSSELAIIVKPDEARDLETLTARIGAEPSRIVRVGEPLLSGRPSQRNIWELAIESDDPRELRELAREVCARLPAGAPAAWRQHDARIRAMLGIHELRGGFVLDADVVGALGGLGLPFACYFYNVGA